MPAWIDTWQETLRVQRQTLRKSARKETLPHWSAAGIFQERSRKHPPKPEVFELGLTSADRGSRSARLKHDLAVLVGRGGDTAHRFAQGLKEDEDEDDDDDEDEDDADEDDPRGIFEQKLAGNTFSEATTKQSLSAKPALVVEPIESTPNEAVKLASSIREEMLGLCRQLGLAPPVSTLQQDLQDSLAVPAEETICRTLPSASASARRQGKRADLASQLREHTLCRARREMRSKRSASVQTAAVYDSGHQVDKSQLKSAVGLKTTELTRQWDISSDRRACEDSSEIQLEDHSWGEIIVQGTRDCQDVRIKTTDHADAQGAVAMQPRQLPDAEMRPVSRHAGVESSISNRIQYPHSQEAPVEAVRAQSAAEQIRMRVAAPAVPGLPSRAPAARGCDKLAQNRPGHDLAFVPQHVPEHRHGLYDVSVIQALRRKATRQAGGTIEPRTVVVDDSREQLDAPGSHKAQDDDVLDPASHTQTVGFDEARMATLTTGEPAAEERPLESRHENDRHFLMADSPASVGCFQELREKLSPTQIPSGHAERKEAVQDDGCSVAYSQAEAQTEPKGFASDSDAVASPLSQASAAVRELPPLPPYRPLPRLEATETGIPAKTGPLAKELEERFYGSLQVLDSVQEHLSVVDLLASQREKALEEERQALLEAQASQEQHLQQALDWLEKQRTEQLAALLQQAQSSELELARRKAAFDEELAAKEKLRQEAEAFERETLQREREELEKQKAFLFALSLQRNYEDQEQVAVLQVELAHREQAAQPQQPDLHLFLDQLLQQFRRAESQSTSSSEEKERALRDEEMKQLREARRQEQAEVADLKAEAVSKAAAAKAVATKAEEGSVAQDRAKEEEEEEKEHLAAARQAAAKQAEDQRVAAEEARKIEEQRLAADRAAGERVAAEEARRKEEQRLAQEVAAKEAAEQRLAQEVAAKEAAEKEEELRLAQEAAATEAAEKEEEQRVAAEEARKKEQRLAQEVAAKEAAEKEEEQRLAAEEARRKEEQRLAQEVAAKEAAEKEEELRLAQEAAAAEAAEKEEEQRVAAEEARKKEQRLAQEVAAKEAAEKEEEERLAAEEARKKEEQRVAQEVAAKEAAKKEEEQRLAAAKEATAEQAEEERVGAEAARKKEKQRAAQEVAANEAADKEEELHLPQEVAAKEAAENEEEQRLAAAKEAADEQAEEQLVAAEEARKKEEQRFAQEVTAKEAAERERPTAEEARARQEEKQRLARQADAVAEELLQQVTAEAVLEQHEAARRRAAQQSAQSPGEASRDGDAVDTITDEVLQLLMQELADELMPSEGDAGQPGVELQSKRVAFIELPVRSAAAFYSGLRGGQLFGEAVVRICQKWGWTDSLPFVQKPFNAEESYLDEAIGYPLAMIGFYFQLTHFFALLPFPLDWILWPLTALESLLELQARCRSAGDESADRSHAPEMPLQAAEGEPTPPWRGMRPKMAELADIAPIFSSYSASSSGEIDGRSFTKLCKDCSLVDRIFSSTDADLIFAKVVPKGQRRITIAEFEKALGLIAERRGCSQEDVMQRVADGAGPALEGTKAEAVRFHDDKTTYTGTHARGGPESVPKGYGHVPQSMKPRRSLSRTSSGACALPNLLGASTGSSSGLERKLSRTGSNGWIRPLTPLEKAATIGRREGCGLLENVFEAYCSPGQTEMDGKGFAKLMKDSKIVGTRFTTTDADLTFAKVVSKGLRRIDFLQFKAALLIVAEKKNVEAGDIFEAVARQFAGPQLCGTRTESVRFHDDISTYTGVHANGGPALAARSWLLFACDLQHRTLSGEVDELEQIDCSSPLLALCAHCPPALFAPERAAPFAKVPDGFWLALRCPMGVIASQFGPKGQEHKILLVGLVGSGKTTLLHSLKAGEVRCLVTHVIVNSGHHRIRGLWRHYYTDVDGLVFIADCNDRDRVDDARKQIHYILREEELLDKPLLVLANKQDLPNAMSVAELEDKLSLNQIGDRPWFIQESVAIEGKGINDGLEWLSRQFDCHGSSG
ncbi:ARF1 [Symbiodinium sp. KB8]|nr:ARF1 [Symbiodinium sp. KB8]